MGCTIGAADRNALHHVTHRIFQPLPAPTPGCARGQTPAGRGVAARRAGVSRRAGGRERLGAYATASSWRFVKATARRLSVAALAVVVALAAVYVAVSPYLAANAIRSAAAHRDAKALSRHVDFPRLRHALRRQFKGLAMEASRRAAGGSDDNPLAQVGAALGGLLAGAVAERFVDAYVTPEGLTALLSGGNALEPPADEGPAASPPSSAPTAPGAPGGRTDVSMRYTSFSTFVVTFTRSGAPEVKVPVTLTREGLAWRITDVGLRDLLKAGARGG